jgi:hypothetical protein
MRRRLVASALLATILSLPLGLAALSFPSTTVQAAGPADADRATAALHYLWAAQGADGSIDGSLGETADFVFGTAAAGFDPSTLQTCDGSTGALGFLATASDAAAADAAKTGKAVLAVVAADIDPSDFEGRDLLARLDALYHSNTGAYGDGSTFAQSFAVLAIEAAGGSAPVAAIDRLKASQGSDGSWSYGTAAPPPGEGDSNSTAIALMALAAAGDHSADAAALAYLHTQQMPDGGFAYQNPSPWGAATSDPDSDAMVLQALVAAGENPESAAWLQGGSSVLTHLRSTQGADGGYAYPGMGESAFTTSQVPAALVGIPYGAAVAFVAGRSLPAITCATPTPTATASPTPAATASLAATASPTPKATPRPTVRATPRPTVEPPATDKPAAQTSPTEPASTAQPSPSAVPAQTDLPSPTGPETPTPAPEGSGSGDPSDPTLAYLAAAALGLLVVVGGGWVLMAGSGRPAGPGR